jgi:hypothetical protein
MISIVYSAFSHSLCKTFKTPMFEPMPFPRLPQVIEVTSQFIRIPDKVHQFQLMGYPVSTYEYIEEK